MSSTQQYTYTPSGQIDTVQFETQAKQVLTDYEYSKLRLDKYSFTLNGTQQGPTTNVAYLNGQIHKVQTDGQATKNTSDDSKYAAYSYTYSDQIDQVTYPKLSDGSYLVTDHTYDGYDRLQLVTNKKGSNTISSYSYEYDNNGNIVLAVSIQSGVTKRYTYQYDKLNRLTVIENRQPTSPYAVLSTITYRYDARGNRIVMRDSSTELGLGSKSFVYNAMNQLTQVTKTDNNGTSRTTNFQYAPDGLRHKKSVTTGQTATTTRYVYNQDGNVIAETNDANQLQASYIWGADRLLAKKDTSGNDYYYLYNGHGDVVQIVDKNGNLKNRYEYDVWGNVSTLQSDVANSFKYAGEIYDEETGLYYLRARYYDPQLGRFINKDTYEGELTNPLSLNLYTYVENNPLIYVDPSGHCGVDNKKQINDCLLDFTPYVGAAKGIQESISGVNLVTGESLSTVNRWLSLAGVIPGGKLLVKGGKAVVNGAVGVSKWGWKKLKSLFGSNKQIVRHAVPSSDLAESILNGINPKFFRSESRFGAGFYLSQEGQTAVAEVAAHGNKASHVIRFEMNLKNQKVLDLTNPTVAKKWGFNILYDIEIHQAIALKARNQGYNVISTPSLRGAGINYVIYSNFKQILKPIMVTPVDK